MGMKNETVLEPLKTFGIVTVYQRKPVPLGARRFVVVNEDTDRILEEFDVLSNAEKWALANKRG